MPVNAGITSISWKFVRNANSWSLPQTYQIRKWRQNLAILFEQAFQVILMHATTWKPYIYPNISKKRAYTTKIKR